MDKDQIVDAGMVALRPLIFFLFAALIAFTNTGLPLGVDSYYYLMKYFHGDVFVFEIVHWLAVFLSLVTLDVLARLTYRHLFADGKRNARVEALITALVLFSFFAMGTGTFRFFVFEPDDFFGTIATTAGLVIGSWLLNGKKLAKWGWKEASLLGLAVFLITLSLFVWAGTAVLLTAVIGAWGTLILLGATYFRGLFADVPFLFEGKDVKRALFVAPVLVGVFLALFVGYYALPRTPLVEEQASVAFIGGGYVLLAVWYVYLMRKEMSAVDLFVDVLFHFGKYLIMIYAITIIVFGTVVPKFAQPAAAIATVLLPAMMVAYGVREGCAEGSCILTPNRMLVIYILLGFFVMQTVAGVYAAVQAQTEAISMIAAGLSDANYWHVPVVNFWGYGYWVELFGVKPFATPQNWDVNYPVNAHAEYIMPCAEWNHYCPSNEPILSSAGWAFYLPYLRALRQVAAGYLGANGLDPYRVCVGLCQAPWR